MEYLVFRVKVSEEWRDILIAELSGLGFDMMEETDSGIDACMPATEKATVDTDSLLERYSHVEGLEGEWLEVENINWNEEWEKNYDPVEVGKKLLIRADFHPSSEEHDLEIVINPRMSFGTGHHATTWLMADAMLGIALAGRSVLDAGCGTGVLAILSEKLGAEVIEAYDISELCTENTLENAGENGCQRIAVQTGVLSELSYSKPFDLIFANINKNALLNEMHDLCSNLSEGGTLYLSGFFEADIQDILGRASEEGMREKYRAIRNSWAVLGLGR